jgi:adenylate cyclase
MDAPLSHRRRAAGLTAALRQAAARPQRLLPWVLPALLLLLLVAGKLAEPQPVVALQRAAFDALQRAHPRVYRDTVLSVIEIDDESLKRYGQWPWPRGLLARMLDRLREDGAAAAAIDIMLAEPDRNGAEQDALLAQAMRRLPTVLGFALSDAVTEMAAPPRAGMALSGPDARRYVRTYSGMVGALPSLAEAASGYGGLDGLTDEDGAERRVPLFAAAFGRLYPSFVVELLRVATGDRIFRVKTAGGSGERSFGAETGIVAVRIGVGEAALTIPTDRNGAIPLHLTPPGASRFIPAWRLLDGSVPEAALAGRVALIAVSARGLADLRPTALGLRYGFDLHAEALEQVLTGDYLARPDWADGLELLLTLLLGAALVALLPRLGAIRGAALAVGLVGAVAVAAWVAFAHLAWQFDAVYPSLVLTALYVTGTATLYLVSDRERAFIRSAFARYLSPALVARLAEDPSRLRLGGERREMSFIFTDIADFTSLSERLGPVALAPILNDYFDGACEIILRHGGTVNEFVGDAIFAFFNAPLDQPDHAVRAAACVRELADFAERFRQRQEGGGIAFGETRIGLHFGSALVGNFGSRQRFKYAALGDVVNTASRIEGLNKYFRTRVCVSAAAADAAGLSSLRPLGRIVLKGKSVALSVFEMPPSDRPSAAFLARYGEAYRLMALGEDAAALSIFRDLHREDPADGPSDYHRARLESGESGDLILMQDK